MTHLLLDNGLGNIAIASVIALAGFVVQRRGKSPWLAHLLWLMVLIKLISPALFTVSLQLFEPKKMEIPAVENIEEEPLPIIESGEAAGSIDLEALAAIETPKVTEDAPSPLFFLLLLSASGSFIILTKSLRDVVRFDRMLRATEFKAPVKIKGMTRRVAQRFGLKRTPKVCLTSARLTPLVWGFRGKGRIVLPKTLVEQLSEREVQDLIAHEIAHIARRDHIVRWIEWVAVILFWWNPLVWWARKNLRFNEEICCDALVIERMGTAPVTYGHTLLSAIESLSVGSLHPPALAARLDEGGTLERRLKMIMESPKTGRLGLSGRTCLMIAALLLLPFGFVTAQEERDEKLQKYSAAEARIEKAIAGGHITRDDGRRSLKELREELWGRKTKRAHKRSREEAIRRELVEQEKRIEELLAKRIISQHQAEKRLVELNEKLEIGEQKAREYEEKRKVLEIKKAQREIELAIKMGDLSALEGKKKMLEMEKLLNNRAKWDSSLRADKNLKRRVQLERDYADDLVRHREIESKKAAIEEELAALEHSRAAVLHKRIAELERVLHEAVKAGKMTKEEARRKLNEARKAPRSKRDVHKREKKDVNLQRYHEHLRAIENEVKAGRLSKKDAELKIMEIEKKLWPEKHKAKKGYWR